MSARAVLADRLCDAEGTPPRNLELLRRAIAIAPAHGDPTEAADATTRAIAEEVVVEITSSEAWELLRLRFDAS